MSWGRRWGLGGPAQRHQARGAALPGSRIHLVGEMGRKKRKMWGGWGPGMNERERERERKERRCDLGPQRVENRWRQRKPNTTSRTHRQTDTEGYVYTESHTLTKVFRATNTHPGEISLIQTPIL